MDLLVCILMTLSFGICSCVDDVVNCKLKFSELLSTRTWDEVNRISKIHCFVPCVSTLRYMFVKRSPTNCWMSYVRDSATTTTTVDGDTHIERNYPMDGREHHQRNTGHVNQEVPVKRPQMNGNDNTRIDIYKESDATETAMHAPTEEEQTTLLSVQVGNTLTTVKDSTASVSSVKDSTASVSSVKDSNASVSSVKDSNASVSSVKDSNASATTVKDLASSVTSTKDSAPLVPTAKTDTDDEFVQTQYRVVTQTGTKPGSDTDSDVMLVVRGDKGENKMYLENPGDDMELGSNDTFLITSGKDIGNIIAMDIIISIFGLEPDWFLVAIEVDREVEYKHYSKVEIYYAVVKEWLGRFGGWNFFKKELAYNIPYKLNKEYIKRP